VRYVIFNVDGKLGDGVLLTFLVEGIIKNDAAAHITVVSNGVMVSLWECDVRINDVIELDRKSWIAHMRYAFSLWRPDFLMFFDNHKSEKIRLFRNLIRAKQVLVEKVRETEHAGLRGIRMLQRIFPNSQSGFSLKTDIASGWEALCDKQYLPRGDEYLIFNPDSSGPPGTLNDEMMIRVLRVILATKLPIVVLGSREPVIRNFLNEECSSDSMKQLSFHRLSGDDGLRKLFSLVKYAKFVVSVDTGVVHVASVLGVKSISIIKECHSKSWYPLSPRSTIVISDSENISDFDFSVFSEQFRSLMRNSV
jgi:ADP-heptose:LPS heptosyltransferase